MPGDGVAYREWQAKRSLVWLTARAWLDDDGSHLWLSHDCRDGVVETMLPDIWRVVDGKIEPSVHCSICELHSFVEVGVPPAGGVS